MTQKTWTQLLGRFNNRVFVDGRLVMTQDGALNCRILWTCEHREDALRLVDAWRAERPESA